MSGESLTGQNNGRAYRDMAPQPNPQYQGQPSNGSAPVPPAPVKSKGKGRQSGDDKDEGGEKKRRRVQRACDVCRKKKIKCDGTDVERVACRQCTKHGVECTFVERARRPPLRNYIEALEARQTKMEEILQQLAPGKDFTHIIGELPKLGSGVSKDSINGEDDMSFRGGSGRNQSYEQEEDESSEDEREQLELNSASMNHMNRNGYPEGPLPGQQNLQATPNFTSNHHPMPNFGPSSVQHNLQPSHMIQNSHQHQHQLQNHHSLQQRQAQAQGQGQGLQISHLLNTEGGSTASTLSRHQSSYSDSNLRATSGRPESPRSALRRLE